MIRCIVIVIFVAILSCQDAWAWAGRVVEVLRGDTFQVLSEGKIHTVKFYGIECPERDQPFSERARFFSSFLLLHKLVEITPVYRDADGLPNGLIRVSGVRTLANEQLVSHGLAWVNERVCHTSACAEWKKLQDLARSNLVGLWTDPSAVSPWEWRKHRRLKTLRHPSRTGAIGSSDRGINSQPQE